MATKWHVNPETGNVGVCSAKIKCDFEDIGAEHFENESDAVKAGEKITAELNGGTINPIGKATGKFGNLPYSDRDLERGVGSVVDDLADYIEDKVFEDVNDYENYSSLRDPAEYGEIEVVLDKGEAAEYFSMAVERFMKDNPDALDELFATGYPFTKNKREAAKIVSKDLISMLDESDSLSFQETPFHSAFEKLGDDKVGDIVERIFKKTERTTDGKEYSIDYTFDFVDYGSSYYSSSYEAVPHSPHMRQLREDLGKPTV